MCHTTAWRHNHTLACILQFDILLLFCLTLKSTVLFSRSYLLVFSPPSQGDCVDERDYCRLRRFPVLPARHGLHVEDRARHALLICHEKRPQHYQVTPALIHTWHRTKRFRQHSHMKMKITFES